MSSDKIKNKLIEYKDLLFDTKQVIQVAIIRSNGKPHVTPNWFNLSKDDFENGIININTAKGRVKARNIKMGNQVALTIMDTKSVYRYLGMEGTVIETITGPEAEDHIDDLMFKYHGRRPYEYRKDGEERIKIKIKIDNVYR